jgi:AhpC/TSA family/Thiol:disulfide interchange protein DsbD, N-terminal
VKLAGEQDGFTRRGLGLAAISDDSAAILEDFAARRRIPFPLLSDPGSTVIERFGLLQPEYPEGHPWHGVPYPGTLVIDRQGIVRARSFESGYRTRVTAGSLFVKRGDAGKGPVVLRTDFFTLTTSTSDREVFPGNRITLLLDFDLKPGHHAYAPGAGRYRPLRLVLDPGPFASAGEAVFPEPSEYHFAPLDETVPVYQGRFRVLDDVTIATGKAIAVLAASSRPRIDLHGRLEYQVCSETVCYPPATLPLEWTLAVRPLDAERVPEALRKPRDGAPRPRP